MARGLPDGTLRRKAPCTPSHHPLTTPSQSPLPLSPPSYTHTSHYRCSVARGLPDGTLRPKAPCTPSHPLTTPCHSPLPLSLPSYTLLHTHLSLPLLSGERSTGWHTEAQGSLHGLTLNSSAPHILYSVYEGTPTPSHNSLSLHPTPTPILAIHPLSTPSDPPSLYPLSLPPLTPPLSTYCLRRRGFPRQSHSLSSPPFTHPLYTLPLYPPSDPPTPPSLALLCTKAWLSASKPFSLITPSGIPYQSLLSAPLLPPLYPLSTSSLVPPLYPL